MAVPDRWDRLDDALVRLRACRSAGELAECAAPLAVEGCAVVAAEVVASGEGGSRVWSRGGPPEAIGGPDDNGLVLPLVAAGRSVGALHVVGDTSAPAVDVAVLGAFADALGSMIALIGAWQRVDRLQQTLQRLATGVCGPAEAPLELAGPVPPVPAAAPAAEPSLHDRLTTRQREVLAALLAGLSNAEIAERLVVSVPTVKSHVRAILRASGAVNRADAIARLSRTVERHRYDAVL
ncbi:LuxR family transcriptional regulator [Streptomyces albus]|nr:LuxR family transcriptional regulator [Streptomyces albus]